MSKKQNLKKEGKVLRRLVSRTILYGIAGGVALALGILAVLLRFSPLEKLYLYLLAGVASLLISYLLAFKKPSRQIKELYESAEKIRKEIEKLGEGNFKVQNSSPTHLQELWETLAVTEETLRDRMVAVYNSLQRIKENVEGNQCQKAQQELESLLANFEQDFEL